MYNSHQKIFFQSEIIGKTLENRNVDLIIITQKENVKLQQNSKNQRDEDMANNLSEVQNFLDKNLKFQVPIVFFSARVHPGEVPSSHVFNGILDFLLKNENNILQHFAFLMVPMINPDGCYRGYWRVDSIGQNLNRFYKNPTQFQQPSIYAIDQIFNTYQKKIKFYIDLHAHSSKYGSFIFGNALPYADIIQSHMFVRLVSINSPDFDYQNCNFTEKNMYSADKSDGLSKEGSGRVAFYTKYNIQHSYTLESNYTKGDNRYETPELTKYINNEKFSVQEFYQWYDNNKNNKLKQVSFFNQQQLQIYTPEHFQGVGKGICMAIMDITQTGEGSRVANSFYQSLNNLKYSIAIQILQQPPFRFDNQIRHLLKGFYEKKEMFKGALKQLIKYLENNAKNENSKEKDKNKNKKKINKT